jgi:hypothetical protein
MNVGCNLWGFGASSMTPQSHSGSTEGNMGKYLGLGKRKYHELMIRDFIFKGNTPKTVMWVSICVALWEVWGHNTVEGGLQ